MRRLTPPGWLLLAVCAGFGLLAGVMIGLGDIAHSELIGRPDAVMDVLVRLFRP